MTNLCAGGGSSSPRSGFANTFLAGSPYISTLLMNSSNPWLVAAGAALGVISVDVPSLCATDPPAIVQLTTPQILSLENPLVFGLDPVALTSFKSNINNLLWPILCQCNSGAQPPNPPAPFIPPTDLPNSNAITVVPGAASCKSLDSGPKNASTYIVLQPGYLFTEPPNNNTGGIVPAGATSVQVRVTIDTAGANPVNWGFEVGTNTLPNHDASSGTVVPSQNQIAGPYDHTFPLHTFGVNDQYIAYQLNPDVTGGTNNARMYVTFYCGGATPGAGNAPCYPDPMTQAMLQQILQLVTLIQRQEVPFAYILGASHPGLTGHGSIAVQGLLGAIITVTASDGGVTDQIGTPDLANGLGWINWGTGDFYTAREFINNFQLGSFPCKSGQYTSIGYSLASGVTITIQEVKRES